LCELKSVTGEVDTEGSLKLAVKPWATEKFDRATGN
jgi:hypothetical protein